jgi:uncharacterized protein (UPF0262 family)
MTRRDTGETDPPPPGAPEQSRSRLVAITLDEKSISRSNTNVVHEREVAIYDILDANTFSVDGRDEGPFTLHLAIIEDRLALTIGATGTTETLSVMLALSAFRRIIRDYFSVCDTYYQAIRTAPPSRIQAIDMGRRALHDEGSRLLIERLKGKVSLDHATARRLFTLICALHWKG